MFSLYETHTLHLRLSNVRLKKHESSSSANAKRKMNKNTAVEKVMQNVDILCHLINYFNLKEQLNLTRVSKQFLDIIVNYKWKNQYKELRVIKTPLNYILTNVLNEQTTPVKLVRERRTLFDEEAFKEFLEKNAENIQKFYIGSQYRFEETSYEFHMKHEFRNLYDMTYGRMKVSEEDLTDLISYCPKLEKLCLTHCLYRNNLPLIVGRDVDAVTLKCLKMLKSLEINCPTYATKYEYRHVEKLLKKLNLEEFILNGQIQHYDTNAPNVNVTEENDKEAVQHPCKQLTLGGFESQVDFDKLNANILNNFINLTNISLNGYTYIILNRKFFQTLSETCNELKFLKLQRFEIENFTTIQSLEEFIMEDCLDITWKDLNKILSDMKLKSFSSIFTTYRGKFEFFQVSPSLEYLNYTGTDEEFLQLFVMDKLNFQNLTTLIWCHHHYKTEGFLKTLSTFCPKLQTLDLSHNKTLMLDITSLEHLHTLSLNAFDELIWSTKYLWSISKHSSLRHLTLFSSGIQVDKTDQLTLKHCDLYTNLLFFNIALHIFKLQQDFYLDLLSSNTKLNLVIIADTEGALVNRSFLRDLIKSPKFPARLKSIKIYGFNIDCQELRDNFEVTFNWIKSITCDLYCFEIHLIL